MFKHCVCDFALVQYFMSHNCYFLTEALKILSIGRNLIKNLTGLVSYTTVKDSSYMYIPADLSTKSMHLQYIRASSHVHT